MSKQLGGKELPAIGMAIGIERLSLITDPKINNNVLISFIIVCSNFDPKAYKIAHDIRSINNYVDIDIQLSDASLKSKLRRANKDNASYAIIVGDDELESDSVIFKPLNEKDSEQVRISISELESYIKNL